MTAQFSSPRSPVLYYAWQDPEPLSVLQNKGALDRQVDPAAVSVAKGSRPDEVVTTDPDVVGAILA